MAFDDSINKILTEAYFSSPYEKMTGVKKQVNIQEDESDSEFKELTMRKRNTLVLAADDVISHFEAAAEEGEPMNKKELGEYTIQKLADLEQRMEGDEYTLHDISAYFKMIGAHTGMVPMTAERYRNIEKQAKRKMYDLVKKAEEEGEPSQEEEPERVAPDPDKLTGFARAKALSQGIDFSKYMQ